MSENINIEEDPDWRPDTGGLNVRTEYRTQPDDPEGVCLFCLEVWPLPQDMIPELEALMFRTAKEHLSSKMDNPGEWEKVNTH